MSKDLSVVLIQENLTTAATLRRLGKQNQKMRAYSVSLSRKTVTTVMV